MGHETDVVTSRPEEGFHSPPAEPCSVTGTACEILSHDLVKLSCIVFLNNHFKSRNLLKN